jgi:hypothetical protein
VGYRQGRSGSGGMIRKSFVPPLLHCPHTVGSLCQKKPNAFLYR